MTLRVKAFEKEDLLKITIQKEQLSDRETADSFLKNDRAITILDGEEPICCIGVKDYCGKTCIASFISSKAGKKMISLVRLLKEMKKKIRINGSYFFVKEGFSAANRLAKIMGYHKTGTFVLDTSGVKYYIYNIGEG